MVPSHNSDIWKVKIDTMAGMVIRHACPPMEMPGKISRNETTDILKIGAPSDHLEVKKYVTPRH